MNQIARTTAPPEALFKPQIRLDGQVGDEMLRQFKDEFARAEGGPDPIVLELTTFGGDADVGRRIATDIRLFRQHTGRRPLFFGKAVVYSAGVTIMAAFPREDRWLARGASLLIHCRSLAKTLDFQEPLAQARKRVEALLNEIDVGLDLEREGFEELIDGSRVSMDELRERAQTNWYVAADEALQLGLIGGVV
ncbi:peptidase S14 [Phenylobacterium sp.]|uniref:peptidase S14 n=1 Tax=Phenylobacterium sp. TaxID=1871053 RepID=UPI0035B4F8AD